MCDAGTGSPATARVLTLAGFPARAPSSPLRPALQRGHTFRPAASATHRPPESGASPRAWCDPNCRRRTQCQPHRGRDAGYPAPPAQIRAGALTHTAPAFGPTTGVLSTRCAGSHAVVVGAPPVSRFPGAASGTCFGSSTSRWPRPFPPPTPPGSHSPLFAGFIGTI